MKLKVRREQNKRARQETNRKNCQNHCERLPPAHTAVLLQRQPKTAPMPSAVHGHNEKLQEGASEPEGSSPVTSLSDKEAKAQRGPGEARGFSQRGQQQWAPRLGALDTAHVDSAPLAQPERWVPLLLTVSGAALLRGRSPRSRVLNLRV